MSESTEDGLIRAYLDGKVSIDDVVDQVSMRPHWVYRLFLLFVLPEDLALRVLGRVRSRAPSGARATRIWWTR